MEKLCHLPKLKIKNKCVGCYRIFLTFCYKNFQTNNNVEGVLQWTHLYPALRFFHLLFNSAWSITYLSLFPSLPPLMEPSTFCYISGKITDVRTLPLNTSECKLLTRLWYLFKVFVFHCQTHIQWNTQTSSAHLLSFDQKSAFLTNSYQDTEITITLVSPLRVPPHTLGQPHLWSPP